MSRPSIFVASVCLAVLLGACAESGGTASPSAVPPSPVATSSTSPSASATSTSTRSPEPSPPPSELVVAVGDIASCAWESDEAVGAAVAEEDAAVIALLGDLVYPNGTTETFANCFTPGWGGLVDESRPAVGNHELGEDDGDAYWALFGERAGETGEGWYSYDIGTWHVIVLNSNCEVVECTPGSEQHDWLLADLAAADAPCTVAYWHHPMNGSGKHGRYVPVDPLWAAAVEGGVELVLAGHEHHYERFTPLGADVRPDPEGVPLIIVGTGGAELRPHQSIAEGSELIIDDTYGYLRLTLAPDGYVFQFVSLDGSVLDAGSGTCE